MADIIKFLRPHQDSFDDAATRLLGEAFDAVCQGAGKRLSHAAREAIAQRIIDAGARGERDPIRLQEAGRGSATNFPGFGEL